MFLRSRSVIGGESVSVGGGAAVSAVLNEAEQSREFEDSGFDRSQSLDAVVLLTDWTTSYTSRDKDYLGKAATARGITWRVLAIRRGAGFITIRLGSPRKGA